MKFILCIGVTIYTIIGLLSCRTLTKSKAKETMELESGEEKIKTYKESESTIKKGVFLNENIQLHSYGAIYKNTEGKFVLSSKKDLDDHTLVAECHFNKVINDKGWDKVSVTTYKTVNSYQQVYMAGYLEARMTADDIYNFYENLRFNNNIKNRRPYAKMVKFFENVADGFSKRVHDLKNNKNMTAEEKRFWGTITLGWTQLEGIIKGYTYEITRKGEFEEKKLTMADFLILQADGEVPELLRVFQSQKALRNNVKIGDENYFKDAFGINTKNPLDFWGQLMWTSKCSAFIKLTTDKNGNWQDLLAGHTTWTEYYELLRSYKHYKFELDGQGRFEKSEITFSSYPGCISSTDDFYLTNHNLLVMETTLEVIDINLYKHVKKADEYIPNFTRVLAATRFAKTADQWVTYFSKYNSGTYSSQWMIIDYKKFEEIKKTQEKVPNLLFMMEQTPDRIVFHDISDYLYKHSFFGSYNRAFLEETKDNLNMALVKYLYGKRFGYSNSSRAKIFSHLQETVVDMKSLKDILRYNGFRTKTFPNDPSVNNPGESVSARFDLDFKNLRNLSGGIDCKITNFEMSKTLSAVAISGPTNENNPNLTTFDWTQSGDTVTKRVGVPEKFDFPYVLMSPKTLCCDNKNDIYEFE